MKGTVKRYNPGKGYGFITCEDGKDVFVHKSSIPDEIGYLREGDQVEFELEETDRGARAKNLKKS